MVALLRSDGRRGSRDKSAWGSICLCHKIDGKLFRRYTKSGLRDLLTECQFADDVALLAASITCAENTVTTYNVMEAADDFGLTVSIPKTKL